MRKLVILVVLLATAFVAGCANTQVGADFRAQLDAPYQLASGDRVRVIVFGQDSLSNSFAVDGAGNIAMPLVGLVRAYGLTTADLARSIEAHLRNGFIREPRVSVEVEAFRPFFVLGEVTTSGQYPFINGMTVQNAIAVAGGFSPRGWQGGADITRIVDGRAVTGTVPLSYPVRPGDTITVKERFF
jgi:polysaccharide export outer membrane protein